jgi:hypothetical protein
MTIQTTEFVRKIFEVEAIRVTRENMDEVAEWCNGKLEDVNPDKYRSGQGDVCIKVPVRKPTTVRQTMAFPGDWVLLTILDNPTFKVYTDKTFHKTFASKAQQPLF